MVVNNLSRFVWNWETTPGTAIITGATSVSKEFGVYGNEIQKWVSFEKEYNHDEYYAYNSKTPVLCDAGVEYPSFKHTFNPCSPWALHALLGDSTDGSPDTIEPLAVGSTPKSMTIRHEQYSGTHPFLKQAVGCYLVNLFGRSARGSLMSMEAEFAWQKFENENTSSRAILTTTPTYWGNISKAYQGQPEVRRAFNNVGGTEGVVNEIWKAEWIAGINWEAVKNADGSEQTIYLDKYKPVELVLYGIFEQGQESDDYIARTVQNIAVKTFKPDGVNYLQLIFNNCRPRSRKDTGVVYKGKYEQMLSFRADKISVNFTAEGTGVDNFATQFPE